MPNQEFMSGPTLDEVFKAFKAEKSVEVLLKGKAKPLIVAIESIQRVRHEVIVVGKADGTRCRMVYENQQMTGIETKG